MFSPSQTKLYSRCQYKWFLSKFLGINDAFVGKRDLAACVGTAVGAALQAHYRGKFTEAELISQAESRYQHELASKCKNGRSVLDCEEASIYPSLIPGMVQAFLKKNPIPNDWKVTHAESPISDDYDAFVDLAGDCPRGWFVADIKCRMNEKPGFMQNSLLKYQFDPQLSQYCREWSERYPEKPLEFYRIIYIVGSPTPSCIWQDFEIDWEYMVHRKNSDEAIWANMSKKKAVLETWAKQFGGYSHIPKHLVYQIVPMASDHMDGYFKCDMWEPCLTYGGKVDQVPGLIQVEKEVK